MTQATSSRVSLVFVVGLGVLDGDLPVDSHGGAGAQREACRDAGPGRASRGPGGASRHSGDARRGRHRPKMATPRRAVEAPSSRAMKVMPPSGATALSWPGRTAMPGPVTTGPSSPAKKAWRSPGAVASWSAIATRATKPGAPSPAWGRPSPSARCWRGRRPRPPSSPTADSSYYYDSGTYYTTAISNGAPAYQVVSPPAGIVIATLPGGCSAINRGGVAYSQCGSTYYQRVSNGYRVVVL